MPPEPSRVKFGLAEWTGLATLALIPAAGFTTWSFRMSERIAIVETIQQQTVTLLDKIERKTDAMNAQAADVVRLHDAVERSNQRLEKIEASLSRLQVGGKGTP